MMHYQASGFYLISNLDSGGLRKYGAAAVNITKGQAMFDNGSGYATNVGTDFASTFLGIAAEAIDNSAGAAGDKNIMVIPPLPHLQFSVPVDNALATQTAVGSLVDIGATNGFVSLADNPTEGWAFLVDEIDVSATAIDGNTYGYVVGHFQIIGTAA